MGSPFRPRQCEPEMGRPAHERAGPPPAPPPERDALRARVAELEAGDDDRRSASIHLRKSQAGRILDGRTWDEMPEDTHG